MRDRLVTGETGDYTEMRLPRHTNERRHHMPEPSQPPPGKTLIAAAAGGFGGALLGVVAASALMSDGDSGETQAAVDAQETTVEIVETQVASQ